jgi:predicted AAA+ superfamily ATPase
VENAVGGHLCNHLNSVEYTLAYWRDRSQEVDFVIFRGKDVWAIEVKSGRSGKNTGLQLFRQRYPKAKTLMVGGTGIPLEEFFSREPKDFLS